MPRIISMLRFNIHHSSKTNINTRDYSKWWSTCWETEFTKVLLWAKWLRHVNFVCRQCKWDRSTMMFIQLSVSTCKSTLSLSHIAIKIFEEPVFLDSLNISTVQYNCKWFFLFFSFLLRKRAAWEVYKRVAFILYKNGYVSQNVVLQSISWKQVLRDLYHMNHVTNHNLILST